MSLQTSFSLKRGGLVLAAVAPLALLAGCSNMASTAVGSGSIAQSAVISGLVHGGRQPVIGSTVTLWAAGNTGYGSAATSLATTMTDATGTFAFHPAAGAVYSCPTGGAASQSLYITAVGGQPTTGVTNTAAAFMVALGDCATVLATNPQVNVNEVTTIASLFALQQFFTPNTTTGLGSVGTSATNLTGLKNAMATVNNLVDISTGTAKATATASGAVAGYTTNPTVTITPEQTKINTLANILAGCVNSNGAGSSTCSPLFSAVNTPAALDTIQAAYYLAINPVSTVAATYTLGSAQSPFNPTLSAQPTDWTIGVTYASASSQSIGTTPVTSYLLSEPESIAVDATGNIWVQNYTGSTVSAANSIAELSPTGTPMTHALNNPAILGGAAGIYIDPTGNVWVPNYGGTGAGAQLTSVVEYTTGGATNSFTTNKGPQRLAIDGQGNVFVLEPSYKGLGDLEEIAAGSAAGSTATTLASGLTTDFSNLVIDGNYTIWITGGGTGALGGTSGYPYLYQFLYSTGSPSYTGTPSATTNAGGVTTPEQAISVDHANNILVMNYGKETLASLSGTTSVTGGTNSPFAVSSTLTKPEFQATDGAGNLWVTNMATTGNVFEISNSGTSISPSAGYARTYGEPYGVAIDPSGNVWVGSYTSAGPNGFITEIVGAAAPVKTPLAATLPATPGGISFIGVRP